MRYFLAIVLYLCVHTLQASTGNEIPFKAKHQSKLYYDLEGAQIVPPAPTRQRVSIRMSASYGLGYSCGQFDPVASLKNSIDNLRDGIDDLENTVVVAASGALASLPMYILQRAYPDLVTEIRNKKAEWQEKFDIAMKSCEQYESEIIAGSENPYGDWVNAAKQMGYEEAAPQDGDGTESDTDILEVKDQVDKDGSCVKWIGGVMAGCEDLDRDGSIQVIADVVGAGYHQILGLDPGRSSESSANSAASGEPLGQKLGTVTEAKRFANHVLGELTLKTGGETKGISSTPGNGLTGLVEDEMLSVDEAFDHVFNGNSQEESDWNAIKSPTAGITNELIGAYKKSSYSDKQIIRNKLVGEIAFTRIIDKALMLRRILLSGVKEPNVYNSPANKQIREALNELNQYIDELMFERRIREELLTDTASKVIQHVNNRTNKSSTYRNPVNDKSVIRKE